MQQFCFNKGIDIMLSLLVISFILTVNYFVCVKSCASRYSIPHLVDTIKKLGPESFCSVNEIYYEETGKCYLFTEDAYESPCGPNMLFEPKLENHRIGRCDCELQKTRPLLYHEQTKQCYYVSTQGPCRVGQWLQLINNSLKCVHNPCNNVTVIDVDVDVDIIVFFNETCVKLNSRCELIDSKNSGTIVFNSNLYPECIPKTFKLHAVGAIESVRCPENTYRTLDGRGCQAPIQFDFDYY